jgi:hypothetical protein
MNIKPFVDLVAFMYEKEKKVEIIRQFLCEIPDFEPYQIYKLLDQNQKNHINSQDISDFLSRNGESFSRKTIESTLIDHFSHFDMKINYKKFFPSIFIFFSLFFIKSFLKMVLPQENTLLRKEVSQKEIKKTSKENPYMEEIEYSLSKIMKEFQKPHIYYKQL